MANVRFNANPGPEEIQAILEGLHHYNAQRLKTEIQPFAVAVTDESQQVIAGISGSTCWGRMHVDRLWVSEEYRHQGIGAQLLIEAEAIARQRKCRGIDLDTMSFQAPQFYEKYGYTVKGRIGGYANDHVKIYYSKEIEA